MPFTNEAMKGSDGVMDSLLAGVADTDLGLVSEPLEPRRTTNRKAVEDKSRLIASSV